jgi:hypothetical protein
MVAPEEGIAMSAVSGKIGNRGSNIQFHVKTVYQLFETSCHPARYLRA